METCFTAVAMGCSRKSITQRVPQNRAVSRSIVPRCSINIARRALFHEHAVSVGIKPIALRNSVFVGAQNFFLPGEGADQHHQGRLRQMEIGEHRRNHFEFESRINEEVCGGRPRGNPTCAQQCRVFESSNRSSAYGNYSAKIAKSLVDGKSSLSRDRIGFGMDFVILDAIHADRLKGSKAYLQSDLDSFDSALADSIENFRGEVKTSCRRGHRATLLGIHSLITLPIGQGVLAFDIRGQWNVPNVIQDRKEIHPIRQRLKTDASLAELPTGNDMGFQFIRVAEEQSFSNADFAPRPNQA